MRAKFEKIVFLPNSDVEYVAADGGGDGHVAEPLPCHDDAGDEVRYRGSSSQEGQPHYLNIFSYNFSCILFLIND